MKTLTKIVLGVAGVTAIGAGVYTYVNHKKDEDKEEDADSTYPTIFYDNEYSKKENSEQD